MSIRSASRPNTRYHKPFWALTRPPPALNSMSETDRNERRGTLRDEERAARPDLALRGRVGRPDGGGGRGPARGQPRNGPARLQPTGRAPPRRAGAGRGPARAPGGDAAVRPPRGA